MSRLRFAYAIVVVAGLVAVWLIVREGGTQANRLVDRILPARGGDEVVRTFREYLAAVRAARGDELLVAEVQAVNEITEQDTRREFWTGLSLGTTTASIRYPATYRYIIRLSDRWRLALDGSTLWVERPVVRPLEPSIDTAGIAWQGSNGWLRWNKDEVRDRMLRQISADAAVRAAAQAATAAPHADAAIAAFVRSWLLAAGGLPADARVAVVPALPDGVAPLVIERK